MALSRVLSLLCLYLVTTTVHCFQSSGNQKAAHEACGLPSDYLQTSHCFADATHHTCCMLGPEARAYADASGNPIGTAAVKAYTHLHGAAPSSSELTPWCTCFGSLVCSHYAAKFDDGTHVEFIYDKDSAAGAAKGATNIPKTRACEAKAREFFKVRSHMTPGIDAETSYGASGAQCPEYHPSENVVDLFDYRPAARQDIQ